MNALSFLSFHACNTEDFQDFLTRIDLFYFVIIIDQRLVLYCTVVRSSQRPFTLIVL